VDRDSRRLSHQKGNKIITRSNVPLSSDGDDGAQLMVGSTLYIKSQGRWMPFKSGSGNINDGWHGSQKYVKLLPRDFISDNEPTHTTQPVLSYSDSVDPAANYTAGADYNAGSPTTGGLGLYRDSSAAGDNRGVGCFVPVPLGYWAIAAKIYASNTWTASAGGHSVYAGVMIYQGNLTNGGATTLLDTIADVNERIIFDTAMLGQESNYCHITINDMPANTLIYGGYVELRRVKTAEAIAEEESETGGDVLTRSSGG